MASMLGVSRNWVSMIEGGKQPSESVEMLFATLEASPLYDGPAVSPAKKVDPVPAANAMDERIPVSWIPLISWARVGEAMDYDELPRHMQKLVPTIVDDPKAFAIEISGDSQEPRYSAGDVATVTPSKPLRQNDTVIARLRDQGVVFKLYTRHGDTVRLSSYNPAYAPFEVHVEDIDWIYPVQSVLKIVSK